MQRDWSWIEDPDIVSTVDQFAKQWVSRFDSLEDARHEAMAYIAEHPSVLPGPTTGSGILYHRLVQRCGIPPVEPARKPKAVKVPTEPVRGSQPPTVRPGTYTAEQVARLAGACFSMEHLESLHDPFGDRIRPEVSVSTYHDPSHANDSWAAVADIRAAYTFAKRNPAGLTYVEEMSFLLRYVLDTTKRLTKLHGGSFHAAEVALTKITNYMNGERND